MTSPPDFPKGALGPGPFDILHTGRNNVQFDFDTFVKPGHNSKWPKMIISFQVRIRYHWHSYSESEKFSQTASKSSLPSPAPDLPSPCNINARQSSACLDQGVKLGSIVINKNHLPTQHWSSLRIQQEFVWLCIEEFNHLTRTEYRADLIIQ